MSVIIDGKKYYGIIYKIQNTITGKTYIGQTTNPRGFNGRYDYKGFGAERVYNYLLNKSAQKVDCNQHLLRSMQKYGFDAFIVDEVFDTADNKDELNEKERYYIDLFDSFKNGYNRSIGGDSVPGAEKPRSKDSPRSKSVCQIGLDGKLIKVWDCISDAAKELNISDSHISQVCKNTRKFAGGFVWVYKEDYDPSVTYKRTPHIKDMGKGTKAVLWLDNSGNIIREFYSLNSVSDILDICPQSVSNICNHKIKNKKYNLIFKSEYMEEQRLNVRGSYERVS